MSKAPIIPANSKTIWRTFWRCADEICLVRIVPLPGGLEGEQTLGTLHIDTLQFYARPLAWGSQGDLADGLCFEEYSELMKMAQALSNCRDAEGRRNLLKPIIQKNVTEDSY